MSGLKPRNIILTFMLQKRSCFPQRYYFSTWHLTMWPTLTVSSSAPHSSRGWCRRTGLDSITPWRVTAPGMYSFWSPKTFSNSHIIICRSGSGGRERGHKPTPSQESNTLSEVSCFTTLSSGSDWASGDTGGAGHSASDRVSVKDTCRGY